MQSGDGDGGPASQPGSASGSVMDGWSIEATLPKPEELDVLAALLPAGTEVFLSTLPHVTLDRQLDAARRIRACGLEPVPHIAARYFADRAALEAFLAQAEEAAAVRSVLVIGGDLDVPRGSFGSALDVLQSDLLQAHGVETVSFAGYPDGHPVIPDEALDEALDLKIAATADLGLRCGIVTQFCFQPDQILTWTRRFHGRHPTVPVRIGLAGPASVKALVRYAMRCGVGVPLGGFGHKLSMASKIARNASPADIIVALDAEKSGGGLMGAVSAHFFSFGGLEKTACWALDAPNGRLA